MIGMIVRPGDTLIVAVTEAITMEEANHIRRRLRDRLPALADVVIVDQVAALATYRPHETEEP